MTKAIAACERPFGTPFARATARRQSGASDRRRALLRTGLLCGLMILTAATGCRGGGNVEFVSLDVRSVDPPPPKGSRFPIDRCTWWKDEQGRVWIAMERVLYALLGEKYRLELRISLRLDKLPSGKAKNYTLRTEELRGMAHLGPAESRFMSTNGTLALYRDGGNRFRGSFRAEVGRYTRELLTGWSKPAKYLLLGEFVAVQDDGRGGKIVDSTESDGFERDDDPAPSARGVPTTQRAP